MQREPSGWFGIDRMQDWTITAGRDNISHRVTDRGIGRADLDTDSHTARNRAVAACFAVLTFPILLVDIC